MVVSKSQCIDILSIENNGTMQRNLITRNLTRFTVIISVEAQCVDPHPQTLNPAPGDSKNLGNWEREFLTDNLLVRIHFIIVMIRWTGLAPWEFEFSFPRSLTSTFLPAIQNIIPWLNVQGYLSTFLEDIHGP